MGLCGSAATQRRAAYHRPVAVHDRVYRREMTAPRTLPASQLRLLVSKLASHLRTVLVALLWSVSALLVAGLFAFKAGQTSGAPELPTLGTIPQLVMRDQTAATVTGRDFRGRISIVDFFFTSCPVMCPRLAARMAELKERLEARQQTSKKHIQLVSISVDPETDTPERLRDYAVRYKAEPSSWSFLTGEPGDLHRIVVDGFKTEYKKSDSSLGIAEIMHGNWFILVDAGGQIRGYYLADMPAEIERLTLDAQALAN